MLKSNVPRYNYASIRLECACQMTIKARQGFRNGEKALYPKIIEEEMTQLLQTYQYCF